MLCSEEALSYADPVECAVTTPTGSIYNGFEVDPSNIVVISIIRAGDSMLDSFMHTVPEASVGKILIQRDEETALPKLFYSKVPRLEGKFVIILDPMLATGGSAKSAIDVCVEKGANISRTIFANVVASPEGIAYLRGSFPDLTIVTGGIDEGLDEKVRVICICLSHIWICYSIFWLFRRNTLFPDLAISEIVILEHCSRAFIQLVFSKN